MKIGPVKKEGKKESRTKKKSVKKREKRTKVKAGKETEAYN